MKKETKNEECRALATETPSPRGYVCLKREKRLPEIVLFQQVIPILRIFDVAKADEFYLGFLGFGRDWDHRFDDNAPLYRQISRNGLVLHLSEHHGDGSPGARLRGDDAWRA
jgi:hypothetical protein